jgi:hypothetical protein
VISDPSAAIKIAGVSLSGRVLTIEFDYLASASSGFELRTPWAIQDTHGASFDAISPALYRFTVGGRAWRTPNLYRRGKVVVTFAGVD